MSLRCLTTLGLLFLAALPSVPAAMNPEFQHDAPGTADPAGLKRFEGSVILRQSTKKFADLQIALERVVFDYGKQAFAEFKKLRPEGALVTTFYREPKDVSTLECLRAYQDLLGAAGFTTLFEGSSGGNPTGDSNTLDNGYGRFLKQVYQTDLDYGLQAYTLPGCDDFRYLAMKKTGENGAGDTYVTVFCGAVTSSWKDPEKGLETGTVVARVDMLTEKPRADRMVVVKAPEMEQSISRSGRVALYGILFDFNKDTLQPASDSTIAEVAALLKADPALKLLVVGHTDNVGSFEFNRDLSARRAAAVVKALASRHGIDTSRLFAFGCSFACPAAPNATEQGREKNRRVELVRWD